MKLGLYSITYLGVWYRGPALTLEDLIGRARQYGYDGMEIDGKRPHGNPLDLPPARCRELRRRADDAGIEIYAVAANNDFSSPIPEHRESQLVYMRELIRMTADLGVRTLRVFAGMARRHDVARRRELHRRAPRLARSATWKFPRERDLGCVPRRADRSRALGRGCRRHARAAEPCAGHEQSRRHAANDSRGRFAAPQGLPRRPDGGDGRAWRPASRCGRPH